MSDEHDDRGLRWRGNGDWDGRHDGHEDRGHDPVREVTRVSTDAQGAQLNSASFESAVSGNGRYVAFQSFVTNVLLSDPSPAGDTYLKDLRTGAVTLVSANAEGVVGNVFSEAPDVSANGRYVAFESGAVLVPEDISGGTDIYVKDLQTGEVALASHALGGGGGNRGSFEEAVLNDGRVVFTSLASALAPNDTNNQLDIFLWA